MWKVAAGPAAYTIDGIHPNAAGCALIAADRGALSPAQVFAALTAPLS